MPDPADNKEIKDPPGSQQQPGGSTGPSHQYSDENRSAQSQHSAGDHQPPPQNREDSQNHHSVGDQPDPLSRLKCDKAGPENHHSVGDLYVGIQTDGKLPPPDDVKDAWSDLRGEVGILVINVTEDHQKGSSIEHEKSCIECAKAAFVAHWPSGRGSEGTGHYYLDLSNSGSKHVEEKERLEKILLWYSQDVKRWGLLKIEATSEALIKLNRQGDRTDVAIEGPSKTIEIKMVDAGKKHDPLCKSATEHG